MGLLLHLLIGLLPVLGFLLVLLWLDSYKLVTMRVVVTVVALGIVVAGACYVVNGLLFKVSGIDFTNFSRYVGPLTEELGKGLVVVALIRMNRVGFLVDAAIPDHREEAIVGRQVDEHAAAQLGARHAELLEQHASASDRISALAALLHVHADLAVLSACETARGRIGAGEGMVGFSWAMFIAGVPSIVVSQWKVESAGTRDLMVNFHRGLLSPARVRKSEALRQAALKVMKNPETNHPFYWGGFVLVGDGR